ncbi:hypothetical protein [Pseudoroseomonas cervicalis]|uniref:hypothetical protein n=1 Tax=Teichococcus cervicalis TaxID=204525 RepID=UPI002781FDD4|nr:hypothetical protein [Pseudoroseomonas cervicalis]MDQ1081106.1 hypothetical protein [Pseudoroseomonas cervicalis]
MSKSFHLSLAPQALNQPILPWRWDLQGAQFSLFSINLGQTPRPEVEQAVLEEVGSYGRQLGRIGDALEVLLRHVRLPALTPEERDMLAVLEGQLAQIRGIKRRSN